MDRKTEFACLALSLVVLCSCSREVDEPQPVASEETPGVFDLVGDAAESMVHRRTARDMSAQDLLADLIAVAEDPELAGDTADDAAIAAAEQRLGIDLPAELETVLRTRDAIGALGWNSTPAIDRASSLGDELGKLFRVEGDGWRTREVLVEDLDGNSAEIPVGDFADYLVLGRDILGSVILYDASPRPKHECCRVVETPVIENDTPTAYVSMHDWLATAWALEKAVD